MKALKISDILDVLGGKLLKGNEEDFIIKIRLNSKLIEEGDTFFALKGETSDGHKYIESAILNGAKTFVISKEEYLDRFNNSDTNVILVKDALISLQDLASYYLSLMPIKKRIAVTGSVGKTTTRDMMKMVMSSKYKTESTIKNYNTPTGIPESIFEFPLDTEAIVIEMGLLFDTTEEALSRFVKPDVAIITNIGVSHIERFPNDGRMGILRSKMGVAHFFNENSTLVLNNDNDLLSKVEKSNKYRQISVGSNDEFDFVIKDVKDLGEDGVTYILKYMDKEHFVKLNVLGAHNAINSALAIAAGVYSGIDINDAISAISKFVLPDDRLSIRKNKSVTIIDDCYNAAPESMKSAIDTLVSFGNEGRKIAILGDMLELGTEDENSHREIGKYLCKKDLDKVILIGKSAIMMFCEYKKADYFENLDDALKFIKNDFVLMPNDKILVKASHGMNLNKVVEELLSRG